MVHAEDALTTEIGKFVVLHPEKALAIEPGKFVLHPEEALTIELGKFVLFTVVRCCCVVRSIILLIFRCSRIMPSCVAEWRACFVEGFITK